MKLVVKLIVKETKDEKKEREDSDDAIKQATYFLTILLALQLHELVLELVHVAGPSIAL